MSEDQVKKEMPLPESVVDEWPQAAPAVPALIEALEALKDQDLVVRRIAAGVLGAMGPQAAPAVPALIEALKDQDTQVRRNAARALTRVVPHPANQAVVDMSEKVAYWAGYEISTYREIMQQKLQDRLNIHLYAS